jgi:predicted amidohydrolase YtcJ
MSPRAAFAAHTRGGWRAVHRDDEGVLVPGGAATFAIWSVPPDGTEDGQRGPVMPALGMDDELPACQRTVLRGQTIFEGEV